MRRVYEIFEVLPNGSPRRVTVVPGLESAKARLDALADSTRNECFVADARTRQIIAMMNVPPSKWRGTKWVFQIAYDEQLGPLRATILRSCGYGVTCVFGNPAAKFLLSSTELEQYDLFIIGHSAPEAIRLEMAAWLKAKYPRVKILALNPPNQQVPTADYNIRLNGPETWLPTVKQHMANSAEGPAPGKVSTSEA